MDGALIRKLFSAVDELVRVLGAALPFFTSPHIPPHVRSSEATTPAPAVDATLAAAGS